MEPDIANTKISVFDDEDGDLPGFLVCTRPERKCWTYMQLGFAHSTKTAWVENPRRGREARNFTTNVPEILDLKWSSEQIFSKNWRWVPPVGSLSCCRFCLCLYYMISCCHPSSWTLWSSCAVVCLISTILYISITTKRDTFFYYPS